MAPQPQRRERPVLPDKPWEEYTRDEILWLLRTGLEGGHRHEIHLYAIRLHYLPSVRDIDHLPEMDSRDVFDACNKSVPVYILRTSQWRLFGQVLHNYIYRRWFRPYRSEIECQRFICKFITPEDLPDEASPSQKTVNDLVSLNSAICAQVKARHRAYEEELASGEKIAPWRLEEVHDHGLHVLQPLFQALLIIVCSKNYRNEDSKTVGRLPVYLVRTGIEDGLSAPITFDSIADKIDGYTGRPRSAIKATLETAIDFVISLEAREAAAFGLQPDPIDAWAPQMRSFPRVWREIVGNELLIGPSSKFVDTEKYSEWTGDGEEQESYIMASHEQQRFGWEAKKAAGTYIWT
ncbi:hypothetical protein F5Y05DRAFT_419618 [Hypoxylon sp. FL0543]|nr:hypothetical protein F5Y05DRAFT_419618 [Hypoxylon sp. FL0543]